MLTVIEYGKDEYDFPALIVLGCFDAIHLGHRELLKKAKLQAKINGLDLGVMMFREGKGGKLVYSFDDRVKLLEQFNVKFVVAIDYNEDFKAVKPLDFLHELEDKINVKGYMSGKDFRFGMGAKGKSSTLKNYAEDEENGVWYTAVKEIEDDGEKVSTTRVKACLDAGDVKKAAQLLGGEFTVSGEVVHGDGRGATVVGYPTVNIAYPDWKHPLKHGVYSVKSTIDDTEYAGVANYGPCPTFGVDRVGLEVYFEGFDGDLYGRALDIKFVDFIRDIETFDSADSLTEQISGDIAVTQSEETVVEETVVEETPVQESVEETSAEPTTAEQTTEEDATAEDTAVEQPTEEAANEEVVTEEIVEETTTEEIVVEEPVEETATEGTVEEADSEQAVTEEVTEAIVTEEATENATQVEEVTADNAETPVGEAENELAADDGDIIEEDVTEEEEAAEEAAATEKKSNSKIYHISKRKSDGKWQVKAAGGQKALRLFATQAEAIEYARTTAKNQDAHFVIHKEGGGFRKLSYGKKSK